MSIMVSLAPLFGWKDENWIKRVDEGECMVILNIESKSEFFNKKLKFKLDSFPLHLIWNVHF